MEAAMPIYRLLQEQSFEPDVVITLSTTFEELCTFLGLAKTTDSLRDRVAESIITCAKKGIRDPMQLRQCALKDLGHRN
jgi:magnesium-transporting ATPase (P-type)